jgi:hypothetical protein
VVSSINKTDHHDITEILLKVALNSITIITLLFYAQICFIFMSLVVEEINFYVFTPNIAKFGVEHQSFNTWDAKSARRPICKDA